MPKNGFRIRSRCGWGAVLRMLEMLVEMEREDPFAISLLSGMVLDSVPNVGFNPVGFVMEV